MHDLVFQVDSLNNLALISHFKGDWKNAVESTLELINIADRLGHKRLYIHFKINLGIMYCKQGDNKRSEQELTESEDVARINKLTSYLFNVLNSKVDLYLSQNRIKDAERSLDDVQEIAKDTEFFQEKCELYRNVAVFYLQQQHYHQALTAIENSLSIAQEAADPREEGMSSRVQADIYYLSNAPLAQILTSYEHSAHLLKNDLYETARVKACWGQVLWCNHNPVQGKVLVDEAAQIFQKVGAKRDLAGLKPIIDVIEQADIKPNQLYLYSQEFYQYSNL